MAGGSFDDANVVNGIHDTKFCMDSVIVEIAIGGDNEVISKLMVEKP